MKYIGSSSYRWVATDISYVNYIIFQSCDIFYVVNLGHAAFQFSPSLTKYSVGSVADFNVIP